jgi:hypothetical protein
MCTLPKGLTVSLRMSFSENRYPFFRDMRWTTQPVSAPAANRHASAACLAGNGPRDKQFAAKRDYPEKIIQQKQ